MSLRRLMQQNVSTSTPNRHTAESPSSGSGTNTPTRARPRPSFQHSPASTSSISSSVPFDWEAARARRPPPYATPQQKRSRSSGLNNSVTPGTPAQKRKAFVRKKTWLDKIQDLPSDIMFEITQFPDNVPTPEPKTTAFMLGGVLHLLNLIVRIYQSSDVPGSDRDWEDMYREQKGRSWFTWTLPATAFLIGVAALNALYLFTRVRVYRMHMRPDPLSSPNAKFVPSNSTLEPVESSSVWKRLGKGSWYLFIAFWRFLLGMQPPPPSRRVATVQQLEVWNPGELEMTLFCVYTPVHPFLWMATNTSNWMIMLITMGLVALQVFALQVSWKAYAKDKDIIASEVMHEYNEGFVNPRLNPIRRDAATMTHESEMVNVWED